jgi:hypothetical protein
MVCSKCGEKFHNALSCSQNPKNIKSPTNALLYLQGQLIDMPLPEGDILKISNGLKKIYDDKSVGEWTITSTNVKEHDIHLVVEDHEYHIKKEEVTWLKKGDSVKRDCVVTGTVQQGYSMPKPVKRTDSVERTIINILNFHRSDKVSVMLGDSRKEFIYGDWVKQCMEEDKILKKAKEEFPPDPEDDCAMEAYMWIGDYRYHRMAVHISNILT